MLRDLAVITLTSFLLAVNLGIDASKDVNQPCIPCPSTVPSVCQPGGKCCYLPNDTEMFFCRCHLGREGKYCERHTSLASTDKDRSSMILLSSVFGFLISLLALVILILIIWYFVKKSKERKTKMDEIASSLENDVLNVQEELEKLTLVEQASRLRRLSKLIEAQTWAALITYPSLSSQSADCERKKSIIATSDSKPIPGSFRRFSAPYVFDTIAETSEPPTTYPQPTGRESVRFISM